MAQVAIRVLPVLLTGSSCPITSQGLLRAIGPQVHKDILPLAGGILSLPLLVTLILFMTSATSTAQWRLYLQLSYLMMKNQISIKVAHNLRGPLGQTTVTKTARKTINDAAALDDATDVATPPTRKHKRQQTEDSDDYVMRANARRNPKSFASILV